jgi:hypothetical protein
MHRTSIRRALPMLWIVLGASVSAIASDFQLEKDGLGPIKVSMKIEVVDERKDLNDFPVRMAEITTKARNESGQPIRRAKLCIQAPFRSKGCDFELSTKDVWKPGEQLTWLAHGKAAYRIEDARIVVLKIEALTAPKRKTKSEDDLEPHAVRNIFVQAIEGDEGGFTRDQLIAMVANSKRFYAVENPTLADAILKGHGELDKMNHLVFVMRLSRPTGEILWAWDDTKPCTDAKPKCAVDDLVAARVNEPRLGLLSRR